MIFIYIDKKLSNAQADKILSLSETGHLVLTGRLECIPTILYSFYVEESLLDFEGVTKLLILEGRKNYNKSFGKFLSNLFSVKAVDVCWLDENGVISEGVESKRADTLFIFPGSIIPLSMGSHQRSFNLLMNMTASGKIVDVLIPDNPKLDKKKVKQSLKSICNRVYFYKDRRKNFSRNQLIKRGIEKRVRGILDKEPGLPDLFSERLLKKPTESLKRWVNNLYLANSYENIVVSYAWMLPCVDYIRHMQEGYNLICDTHDVQFYRNENILSRKERVFFNKKKEKNLEIKALNQCDVVIAISEMDRQILSQSLRAKVISVYPGFDYAKTPIKQRPVGRPIHFGFIGGGMKANVQSLEFVIENWWPVIKQHSPDSIFYIAGSVCNNDIIKEYSFFDRNIVLMGFVKNINDFYNSIEVALNPVIVTGGLNFKSVEAVCAGKHLFTNDIGIKCLTDDFPCIVIHNPNEIIDVMNKIEFNLQEDKTIRLSNQKRALEIFGNQNVIRTIAGKFLS